MLLDDTPPPPPRDPRPARRAARVAAAFSLLAPLAALLPTLFLPETTLLRDDNLVAHLGDGLRATAHLTRGELPFMGLDQGLGRPLWIRAGVLYPGTWLAVGAARLAFGDPHRWLELLLLAHLALAGLGAYLLARQAGASARGAALGGVTYGLSGMLLCLAHNWMPAVLVAAWLPWLLWLQARVLDPARGTRAAWVALAIGWALVGYTGHPQFVLHAGVVAVLFALEAAAPLRTRAFALLAGVVGALLAAPLLLPQWEAARASGFHTGGALPLASFLHNGLTLDALAGVVAPARLAPALGATRPGAWTHLGFPALLFAALGLLRGRRRRPLPGLPSPLGLLGIALLLTTFAAPETSPVYRWTHAIPIWNGMRWPFRFFLPAALPLALLAAHGHALLDRQAFRASRRLAAAAAVIGAGSLALNLQPGIPWAVVPASLAVGVLAAWVPLSLGGGPRLPPALPVATAGVLGALVAGLATLAPFTMSPGERPPRAAVADLAPGARTALVSSPRLGVRVDPASGVVVLPVPPGPLLAGGVPTTLGVPSLGGCDPFAPAPLVRVLGLNPQYGNPRHPGDFLRWIVATGYVRALGVRYLRVRRDDPRTLREVRGLPGIRERGADGPVAIFEVEDVPPPIHLVRELAALPADPGPEQVPAHRPPEAPGALATATPADLTALGVAPGPLDTAGAAVGAPAFDGATLRVRVSTPRPGVVRFAYARLPGWRLLVDGAPAPLVPLDGLVMGARLDAGEHDLALGYRPPGLDRGLALAAAGLLALLALAASAGRFAVE